jgi:hypothetical protein
LLAVIASIQLALRRLAKAEIVNSPKPLACTAQWRKSANRVVKMVYRGGRVLTLG